MSDSPSKEVVENWTDLARIFGDAITSVYPPEASITPYIHVFIYHVGYYLKELGNIECFANYDTESWHKINKQVKAFGTPGYGGRGTTNIAEHQLQYQERLKRQQPELNKKDQPPLKKQKTWTEKVVVSNINNNNDFNDALKHAQNKTYKFKRPLVRRTKAAKADAVEKTARILLDLNNIHAEEQTVHPTVSNTNLQTNSMNIDGRFEIESNNQQAIIPDDSTNNNNYESNTRISLFWEEVDCVLTEQDVIEILDAIASINDILAD